LKEVNNFGFLQYCIFILFPANRAAFVLYGMQVQYQAKKYLSPGGQPVLLWMGRALLYPAFNRILRF
jgi:hypothetical protein